MNMTRRLQSISARTPCSWIATLCLLLIIERSEGFFSSVSTPRPSWYSQHHRSLDAPLFAKKKGATKKPKAQSASGFGGAATEPCPCGSGKGYMTCCGKLHLDPKAHVAATAEQVVRARYSAYAKRQIDFIIASTHPLNKDFATDIDHWKKTIDQNGYDNFELTHCDILNESYDCQSEDCKKAKVQFVASMLQRDSRQKSSFMETSLFERGETGAWLYLEGAVESWPGTEGASNNDDAT